MQTRPGMVGIASERPDDLRARRNRCAKATWSALLISLVAQEQHLVRQQRLADRAEQVVVATPLRRDRRR